MRFLRFRKYKRRAVIKKMRKIRPPMIPPTAAPMFEL